MKRYKWKICIEDPFLNCEYIYPIQQKYIKTLVDHLSKNPTVKNIIIFGSSTTPSCHIDSDIDIYLELDENIKVRFPYIEKAYDYWNNFTVNELLLNEIKSKGVNVYARK